jgi:hypothetical protein
MAADKPEQQQRLGCITLAMFFFIICWGIGTVYLVTHPPVDFLTLSVYTTVLALFFFLCSPWGRSLISRSPIVAMSPILISFSFGLYLLLKQYSLNSPQVFLGVLAWVVFLFSLSPWMRYVLRWMPFFLIMLIMLSGILATYPIVVHRPVDYSKLFTTLFANIVILSLVLLLLWFFQRMFRRLDETKQIDFSFGHAHFPQGETTLPEKSVVDIHFLGVSLQIFRSGKFTKVTISTD